MRKKKGEKEESTKRREKRYWPWLLSESWGERPAWRGLGWAPLHKNKLFFCLFSRVTAFAPLVTIFARGPLLLFLILLGRAPASPWGFLGEAPRTGLWAVLAVTLLVRGDFFEDGWKEGNFRGTRTRWRVWGVFRSGGSSWLLRDRRPGWRAGLRGLKEGLWAGGHAGGAPGPAASIHSGFSFGILFWCSRTKAGLWKTWLQFRHCRPSF